MHRKQKTEKYLNLRFPNVHPRPSVKYTPILPPHDRHLIALMRTVVEGLVSSAERTIALRENANRKASRLIEDLVEAHCSFRQNDQHSSLQHDMIVCQPEPLTVSSAIGLVHKQKSKTTKEASSFTSRQSSEGQKSIQEINEERRASYMRRWKETQKCDRKEFVPLHVNTRTCGDDGHNQQLQQLLRRKKELSKQTKQSQLSARLRTQIQKTMSVSTLETRDKEKRQVFQDDQGRPIDIQPKQGKLLKYPAPIIKLSHIRIMPTQQATTNPLKKKPIMDLVSSRKTKRKGVGDTCVLIEQMYDQEVGKTDLDQVLQEAWRPQKGARFTTKQQRTVSVVKLPSIR